MHCAGLYRHRCYSVLVPERHVLSCPPYLSRVCLRVEDSWGVKVHQRLHDSEKMAIAGVGCCGSRRKPLAHSKGNRGKIQAGLAVRQPDSARLHGLAVSERPMMDCGGLC
jgi:hypothetical protein